LLAADSWAWRRPGGKDGFEYARRALGSSVEDLEIEVLDISPETVGQFDVVLFLGVLYHMRHPLLALERAASVTRELLTVETLVDLTFLRTPAAAFYPSALLGDTTNWWGPNRAAVEGMLRAVGFERVVSYRTKRRLQLPRPRHVPARAKVSAGFFSDAAQGTRLRVVRDVARGVLTQGRLVSHASWR
jgi:hypothetical protein